MEADNNKQKVTELEKSSVFRRFRLLTLLFLLVRLMKEDRASLGLQPGGAGVAAFDLPGTFSRMSWQPMSRTSRVPEENEDNENTMVTLSFPQQQ